jgi:hypothetical protein
METVYDHGKVIEWDDFTTVRNRVKQQWSAMPLTHDPISTELKEKIEEVIAKQSLENANLYE